MAIASPIPAGSSIWIRYFELDSVYIVMVLWNEDQTSSILLLIGSFSVTQLSEYHAMNSVYTEQ